MTQTNSNALVALKLQDAKGTMASGNGATVLRQAGGQGGQLTKAVVGSKEVRRDGMNSRGRHGSQRSNGSYDQELTVEGLIAILEAVVRDTWDANPTVVDEAFFTSITTEANAIAFTAGDPRTKAKAGDVIRLTNHASAGNNNRNIRVASVDATKIHTVESLTVNAVPDTDCEITIPRKLVQYKGGALLKRYFTIEERDLDIDASEVFGDCVFTQIKFTAQADGIVMVSVSWVGTGLFDTAEAGPQFTNPVETASIALSVADATFQIEGVDDVDLQSWDLTLNIGGVAPATFGKRGNTAAPDVFTGNATVELNFTVLREDLQPVKDLADEVQYSFSALLEAEEAQPSNFLSIFVGNATLGKVTKSALSNQAGARTVSVSAPAELIGKDIAGGDRDPCMVKFQTSITA